MNPVDWNEYEPTFPDFLPPVEKPQPVVLNDADAQSRIEGVLKAAGIKVRIGSCGCCPPWMVATFPDGAVFDGDIDTIAADGYTRR
jgi:hypothetical protein